MKHPILRIVFLLATIAAIAAFPLIYTDLDLLAKKATQQTAEGVGRTFHIAGQEEVDESGIVLNAQDEAEVGELVRLDASASNVDGLTWQIIPATPDFEVIEDGRRAFFSSRVGGSYLIIIAAAKDSKPFLQHHTIEVIGETPEPGPENITSKVRRWAKNVKDYEGKKAHALALAGVFRKLGEADDITVDQILEATATANSAVLGDHVEDWLPFLEPLGEELDAITQADGLATREQYKEVWLKIADGLEKAA